MHLENRATTANIRGSDRDLPVEATWSQQRRVQDVRAVGRGDEDDAAAGVEPVHFDQQLVEGLLPFVMPAAESGTALAAHRVDLVDEDDARGVLLGLLEQIADTAGTHADEHL